MYSTFKYPHPVMNRAHPLRQDLAMWINFTDPYHAYLHDIAQGGRSNSQGGTVDGDPYNFGEPAGFESSPYGPCFNDSVSEVSVNRECIARPYETNLPGDWTLLYRGRETNMDTGTFHNIATHVNAANVDGWSIYFAGTLMVIASWHSSTPYWSYMATPVTSNTFFTLVLTWKSGSDIKAYFEIDGTITIPTMFTVVPWIPPPIFTGDFYVASFVGAASGPSRCAEFAIWNRWMDDSAVSQIISGIDFNNMPRSTL